MLSGFECDEDHTGWLAGAALWATGAAAGCLLAVAMPGPSMLHWQTLVVAAGVSLVSLGLRLPVELARCSVPASLSHAVWLLGLFAQVNWAGFLAARAIDGTVAAEALLICLGPEIWLLSLFIRKAKLPWLPRLVGGEASQAKAIPAPLPAAEVLAARVQGTVAEQGDEQGEAADDSLRDIRREFVDGIDENGERYLAGSVRLQFAPQQRSEVFVLSFCPALEAIAELELECDSELITARVEHATETGARISVRRHSGGEPLAATIDWFAKASVPSLAAPRPSLNLP